jgi:hypothetical protein
MPRITKSGKIDGRSKSSAQNGKNAAILVKKALHQVKQKNVEFNINSDDSESEYELEAEPEPEQEQEQEVKELKLIEPKPIKKELIDYEKLLKEREDEWNNKYKNYEEEWGGKIKQKESEYERLLREKEEEIKQAKLGFIKTQRHRMAIKF